MRSYLVSYVAAAAIAIAGTSLLAADGATAGGGASSGGTAAAPASAVPVANVPAAGASDTNAPSGAGVVDSNHAEFEGRLVDLNSASLAASPSTPASPPVPTTRVVPLYPMGNDLGSLSVQNNIPPSMMSPPSPLVPDVQVITSGIHPFPSQIGVTGWISPFPNSGSFGTYTMPVAIRSGPSMGSTAGLRTYTSADGGITMTVGSSAASIDTSNAGAELRQGVPAAVVVGNRTYTLSTDSRQLAPYAGQIVRVSGTMSSNGAVVPTHVEVRNPGGDFHEIPLNPPTESKTGFATER